MKKRGGKDTKVSFTQKKFIYNITLVQETNRKLHPVT
jgi:hypothetical protein